MRLFLYLETKTKNKKPNESSFEWVETEGCFTLDKRFETFVSFTNGFTEATTNQPPIFLGRLR